MSSSKKRNLSGDIQGNHGMKKIISMATGLRWAFRFGSWRPTEEEWTLAAGAVQPKEKDRIGRFVFKKDAKSAMAGRLLLRKAIHQELQIPYKSILLDRTEKGKPFLTNAVPPDMAKFNFNVSHQGEYAVLATEHRDQVGIDIMKVEYPRGSTVKEFFDRMSRQFTHQEWRFIKAVSEEYDQISRFYRLWCLKESYVKALGVGIGFELQRLDFHVKTSVLPPSGVARDTELYVDGKLQSDWLFEETRLDSHHHVAVALHGFQMQSSQSAAPSTPQVFRHLTFAQLTDSAQLQSDRDATYWQNFSQKMEKPGVKS